LRHRGGQCAHLYFARHLEFLPHTFALDERLGHAYALKRDGALRGQHGRQRFVVLVENPIRLVEDLHDSDENVLVIDQRQGQHAARPVAGSPINLRIETLVRVAVRDVDDPTVARAGARNAGARRDADRGYASRDFENQLVRGGIVQPHRTAIGMKNLFSSVHHLGQHRHQVEGSRQLGGNGQYCLHVRHRQATPAWSCEHQKLASNPRGTAILERGLLDVAIRLARAVQFTLRLLDLCGIAARLSLFESAALRSTRRCACSSAILRLSLSPSTLQCAISLRARSRFATAASLPLAFAFAMSASMRLALAAQGSMVSVGPAARANGAAIIPAATIATLTSRLPDIIVLSPESTGTARF